MTDGKTKYVSVPEDAWELAGGIVLSGEHDKVVARAEAAEADLRAERERYEPMRKQMEQLVRDSMLVVEARQVAEAKLKALQEAVERHFITASPTEKWKILREALAKSKEPI